MLNFAGITSINIISYIGIFVRYSTHQRNKIYLLYVSIFCKGYIITGYKAAPIKPTIPLINATYLHPFKGAAITIHTSKRRERS